MEMEKHLIVLLMLLEKFNLFCLLKTIIKLGLINIFKTGYQIEFKT